MSGDGLATPTKPPPRPYAGFRQKLVVAFDVGTTFSGISYCILDPGQLPNIKRVTRFPGQDATSTSCKIPTVIYYDREGAVKAVGAETTQVDIDLRALEEDWCKAEWFKLHLRSDFGDSGKRIKDIPSLPEGKTVVQVMADFLSYLLACTGAHIREAHHAGTWLWEQFVHETTSLRSSSSRDGIDFVLSHPNGWEWKEQAQMRDAAVRASLIPDTLDGHKRISFVTEGEASLHFAVHNELLWQVARNEGIVVVDAGGGTIDVSTYHRRQEKGDTVFEEITEAQCYFQGSVFVTLAAQEFLRKTLANSCFLDQLEHITDCFDKTTKLRFGNSVGPQYIKFGGSRDNDSDVDIRFGQMKLAGTDVAGFFWDAIDCVVQAVMDQRKKSPQTIRHVVLVGGFAASARLFNKVRDILSERGMTVVRPENSVVKVVSDGAISFYIDHLVNKRVAKVTYGVRNSISFDPKDKEHQSRSKNIYTDPEGVIRIGGAFNAILRKGTQIDAEREFKSGFFQTRSEAMRLQQCKTTIYCYRGDQTNPEWMDIDSDNYTTLFTVLVNVPSERHVNANGDVYYRTLPFDVVMLFGLTEIKVFARWREEGVEKSSEVRLITD